MKFKPVKLTAITKQAITELAQQLTADVIAGNSDALPTDLYLKAIADAIDEARKLIKEQVVKEADGCELLYGVKISIRKGFVTPDYAADTEYKQLAEALEARKEALLQRFKQAQAGYALIKGDTGEVIPIVPIKSSTADTVAYTFPK